MRLTQSKNVPLSCLSQPLANRLAEAAYRDILGLCYARTFSAEWNTTDRDYKVPFKKKSKYAMEIFCNFLTIKSLNVEM